MLNRVDCAIKLPGGLSPLVPPSKDEKLAGLVVHLSFTTGRSPHSAGSNRG
jgi:hypothetical protein